jgi:ribulose kinase
MIPGMWLTEGGQSATGSLVDHTIFSHCRSRELQQQAENRKVTVYQLLNERLEKLGEKIDFPALLTKNRHILPYFHGNRSPRANPNLRGVMTGLKLDDSVDELALNYLATIQSIAYGTKHIIETLNQKGYQIDTIFACGGGTKNPVFLREHADITGCRLVLPCEPEAVLLGSAVLAAVASGTFGTVTEAMSSMNAAEKVIEPAKGPVADYHNAKYKVFLQMYEHWKSYEKIMASIH